MIESRKEKITIKNHRPSLNMFTGFMRRHKEENSLERPTKEEKIQYRSNNGDIQTTHFSVIEKLIQEHVVVPSRIANLEETRVSPNRSSVGRIISKRVIRNYRSREAQIRGETFNNFDRITIMPAIFYDGSRTPPLFFIEWKYIPYRIIDVNNQYETEKIFDCLHEGLFVATLERMESFYSGNFVNWAERFGDVRPKTALGRKSVLIYDGFKCHLGPKAIDILHKNNVIVYALLLHKSGKLQTFDVRVFGPYKFHFSEAIQSASSAVCDLSFDQFDLFHIMKSKYCKALTKENNILTFKNAGMVALDTIVVLGVPRPASFTEFETILSFNSLTALMAKKRADNAQELRSQTLTVLRGSLDTQSRLVVTREC